jgi:hypothetical protein
MNDYRRPSPDQINIIYRCNSCRSEQEVESCNAYQPNCCGLPMVESGESYPSDSSEWNEERENINDEFRDTRRRY